MIIVVSIRPYIFSADPIAGNNHLLVYLHVFVWCNSAGNFCFPPKKWIYVISYIFPQTTDFCGTIGLPSSGIFARKRTSTC
jgi:hypothetical protein